MAISEIAPDSTSIAGALSVALEDRQLLTHPFYRRWEVGELASGELAAYAAQYRRFEAVLPDLLGAIIDGLESTDQGQASAMVSQNLADELGNPEPHLALFDRFAATVGYSDSSASDVTVATENLVATYGALVADGPLAGLAGLAAYETQAAAIAASKADGLRRWYGLDTAGTEFWDVHATLDAEHGMWTLDALAAMDADPVAVGAAARLAADAWWAFLDDRESEAVR